MSRHPRLLLLSLLLWTASPSHAAKPELPFPLSPALQVELLEAPREIAVTVPQTASAVGMQFGLIGAAIGSAVQNAQVKKAEEAIVPIRDMMVEYRFNERFAEVLRAKLASDGLSPAPILTVRPTAWGAVGGQPTDEMPPEALVLLPEYAMDSDFRQLRVGLQAGVADRTVRANGKVRSKVRVQRTYAFEFPLQTGDPADPLASWTTAGREGLSALLDQGIDQVTDMLVHDFSAEGRSAWQTATRGDSTLVAGERYDGTRVRGDDGWAWVRRGKGAMQRLTGYRPLSGDMLAALGASATGPVPTPAAGDALADPPAGAQAAALPAGAGTP